MARKSAESFAKRQKEIARKEKAQKKFEKRLERRRAKTGGGDGPEVAYVDGFEEDLPGDAGDDAETETSEPETDVAEPAAERA